MTNSELMLEGVNLMIAGMGFVMIFLLILIYAIGFASKLINRFLPEAVPAAAVPPVSSVATPAANDIDRLRPAIVAAIIHHRRQQGLK